MKRYLCVAALFTVGTCFAQVPSVSSLAAAEPRWSWLDELWKLPLFGFFGAPAASELPALEPPSPAAPPCAVEPLAAITDPEALAFEASVGNSAVVDTDGLTPGTARALVRFSRIVTSAGGTITVTSAYRPSPYQEHLQAVWDKWITELRGNRDEACQSLRDEVQQEFERHQLLETQRPATFSDHTRGIAFDAAVTLPRFARRRVSADSLARRAGLRRPDVLHDPVHFRFIASRV